MNIDADGTTPVMTVLIVGAAVLTVLLAAIGARLARLAKLDLPAEYLLLLSIVLALAIFLFAPRPEQQGLTTTVQTDGQVVMVATGAVPRATIEHQLTAVASVK